MIKKHSGKLVLFQFESLNKFAGIFHFVTTRTGGFSAGKYSSFNLAVNSVDNKDTEVENNFRLLSETINISANNIIVPAQCHSDVVKVIHSDDLPNKALHCDALITNSSRVCLAVKSADCVPILLCVPNKKVIAAVHSGWRGTVKNILGKTIETMRQEFNIQPKEIYAAIGPSISQENYEVGAEVYTEFKNQLPEALTCFKPRGEKYLLNLWEANKIILKSYGIPESQMEISEMCTFENEAYFYSARRDTVETGRFLSGIVIEFLDK